MNKITVKVEGMRCPRCEAHANEAIQKNFDIKEVTSSHSKGETIILSENVIDEEKLKDVIKEAGYEMISVSSKPYKKGLFSIFKK